MKATEHYVSVVSAVYYAVQSASAVIIESVGESLKCSRPRFPVNVVLFITIYTGVPFLASA